MTRKRWFALLLAFVLLVNSSQLLAFAQGGEDSGESESYSEDLGDRDDEDDGRDDDGRSGDDSGEPDGGLPGSSGPDDGDEEDDTDKTSDEDSEESLHVGGEQSNALPQGGITGYSSELEVTIYIKAEYYGDLRGLGNVKFDLYAYDENQGDYVSHSGPHISSPNTTDGTHGIITLSLPAGRYYLEEAGFVYESIYDSRMSYFPREELFYFEVTDAMVVIFGDNFDNGQIIYEPHHGIGFNKYDSATNRLLPGAKFQLYIKEGGEYILFSDEVYESDYDGRVWINNLPYRPTEDDCYYIREIEAPAGYTFSYDARSNYNEDGYIEVKYQLNEKNYYATVKHVYNDPIPNTEVTIYKKANIYGTLIDLGNVNFDLYAYDDVAGDYVYHSGPHTSSPNTTDGTHGTITLSLPAGRYYLEETGFVLDALYDQHMWYSLREERFYFEVTDAPAVIFGDNFDGDGNGLIINQPHHGIRLLKLDSSTGALLPGAKFQLYIKENGDYVLYSDEVYETGSDGRLYINELPYRPTEDDCYYIKEFEAPDGYTLSYDNRSGYNDDGYIEVKYDRNQKNYYSSWIEVYNDPIPNTEVTIYKKYYLNGTYFKLGGVNFDLYAYDDAAGDYKYHSGPYTTSTADGAITLTLPAGRYYLKEDADVFNLGYIPREEPFYFEITDALVVDFGDNFDDDGLIINEPYYGISIVKLDSQNYDHKLAGAKFGLFVKENGEYVPYTDEVYVTDSAGYVYIDYLPVGTYYVKELEAPPGYAIDLSGYIEVNVSGGKGVQVYFYNDPIPNTEVTIYKGYDYNGSTIYLGGVKFDLYAYDDVAGDYVYHSGPHISSTNTSDGTLGTITLSLPAGRYYLLETGFDVDLYYFIREEPFYFEIADDLEVTFGDNFDDDNGLILNEPHRGIRITKVDKDNHTITLQGAKFQLFVKEGNDYVLYSDVVYETDEKGNISIDELPLGTYYVRETESPEGYRIYHDPSLYNDDGYIEVTLNFASASKTYYYYLAVENEPVGSLELTKVEDGVPTNTLAGAEFDLYQEDYPDDIYIGSYTTDENGVLSVTDLEFGYYYLVESKAPDGYELDPSRHGFVVDSVNKKASLTVENTRKSGDVEIIKVDEGDSSLFLSGAVFDLYYHDGTLHTSDLTSGADGVIEIKALPYGSYYLVETAAPPNGYVPLEEPIRFTVDDTTTENQTIALELEIANEKVTGSVTLVKYNEDETRTLSGAIFALYAFEELDSWRLIGEHTTDETGEIAVGKLPFGRYRFVETKAPDGYVLGDSPATVEFEIGENNDVDVFLTWELTVTNVAETIENGYGRVQLTKVDSETDKALRGAVFALYSEDGTKLGEYTTDLYGVLRVSPLDYGNYYFVEIQAPNGYVLDSTPIPFTLSEQTVDQELYLLLEVDNQPEDTQEEPTGGVRLIKYNQTKTSRLSGAVFSLYTGDGSLVSAHTTNSAGEITVTGLPYGSYYFVETHAPSGYVLDSTQIAFTISEATLDANALVHVEATNRRSGGGSSSGGGNGGSNRSGNGGSNITIRDGLVPQSVKEIIYVDDEDIPQTTILPKTGGSGAAHSGASGAGAAGGLLAALAAAFGIRRKWEL